MGKRVLEFKASLLFLGLLGFSFIYPLNAKAQLDGCEKRLTDVAALGNESQEEAGQELKALFEMQIKAPDTTSAILNEEHSLKDLLSSDPKTNLVKKSAFIAMNAAQRMLALIYSQGKSRIRLASGEEVDFYPFFSSGTAATKGYRIIGNEKALSEFVNNIKAQAAGDRSGSAVVLLVANSGTGKTETLKTRI